jgi:hypothetical protein
MRARDTYELDDLRKAVAMTNLVNGIVAIRNADRLFTACYLADWPYLERLLHRQVSFMNSSTLTICM